jgi:hypothetical protein
MEDRKYITIWAGVLGDATNRSQAAKPLSPIDCLLSNGSPEAVERIANFNRTNYVFASKYCNHHRPRIYPKCDKYVRKMLWEYKQRDPFIEFYRYELEDRGRFTYARFVEILNAFINTYQLWRFSLDSIDRFLWMYGKELFHNDA